MGKKRSLILIISGLISSAIVYWPLAYGEHFELLGIGHWTWTGILAGTVCLISGFIIRSNPLKYTHWIILGVVVTVMLRVVFDTLFIDKTHHNLWPFEVISAMVFSAVFCYPLAALVYFIRRDQY